MTSVKNDKATLLKQRDALREKLSAIEADARRGLDADSEERAVQLENADVLNEIARVTAEEIERVEVALSEQG